MISTGKSGHEILLIRGSINEPKETKIHGRVEERGSSPDDNGGLSAPEVTEKLGVSTRLLYT